MRPTCLFLSLVFMAALGLCSPQSRAARESPPPSASAKAYKPIHPPEWLDRVRVSARPELWYWYVQFGCTPDNALRSEAKKAVRQLGAAQPETRKRALAVLKDIAGAITLPDAARVLKRIAQTDPHVETVRYDKLGHTRREFTIREDAGKVLAQLNDRVALEHWLAQQPRSERVRNIVAALSNRGPDWRYTAKPAADDILTMWLVRHPADSLPVLMTVESGQPFVGSNGRIPTIETPNQAARVAAATVIGVNKVAAGAPYLVRLLQDPTCHVTFRSQPRPSAEPEVAPENLVRSYTVRDVAAGALKRLGYVVTFDGGRYQAQKP